MLIGMWTNAAMCRVNVQNVLPVCNAGCQSLAPFTDGIVNHFLVRMVPFLLNTLAALPRPWSVDACTYSPVGLPHRIVDGVQIRTKQDPILDVTCRIRTASRALPTATRTTIDAAGSVNLTQYSLNSTQRPVFIPKHSQYFCCSIELLLSQNFYLVLIL